MHKIALALVMMFSLPMMVGCVQKDLPIQILPGDQSVVIPPGYKVVIDGKKAAVLGFSNCSIVNPGHPNGGSIYEGIGSGIDSASFNSCVRIRRDDTEVGVLVLTSDGSFREQWVVENHSQIHMRFSLRRPNGDLVAAYKE